MNNDAGGLKNQTNCKLRTLPPPQVQLKRTHKIQILISYFCLYQVYLSALTKITIGIGVVFGRQGTVSQKLSQPKSCCAQGFLSCIFLCHLYTLIFDFISIGERASLLFLALIKLLTFNHTKPDIEKSKKSSFGHDLSFSTLVTYLALLLAMLSQLPCRNILERFYIFYVFLTIW